MLKEVVYYSCLIMSVDSSFSSLIQRFPSGLGPALLGVVPTATFEGISNLTPNQTNECANTYLDVILFESRAFKLKYGFDPLVLPDVNNVTFPVVMNLTNGWAYNVSDVRRNGNVQMEYTNRVLTVSVPLILKKINFKYDYKARFLGLGPNGGITGFAENIKVYVTVVVDFVESRISLKECTNKIQIGNISVSLNGNILTDLLVNLLSSIVVGILGEGIKKQIINQICQQVSNIFDTMNDYFKNLSPVNNNSTTT